MKKKKKKTPPGHPDFSSFEDGTSYWERASSDSDEDYVLPDDESRSKKKPKQKPPVDEFWDEDM